ncbi:hypothetical protein HGRIS_007626 [Hohenbuehelia grisea]|uniref:Uncharacterized protein n=1 Tax=Hohenbuehelia grisea TaxID=104357 RepID=A0ABR3J5T7_9AGAR
MWDFSEVVSQHSSQRINMKLWRTQVLQYSWSVLLVFRFTSPNLLSSSFILWIITSTLPPLSLSFDHNALLHLFHHVGTAFAAPHASFEKRAGHHPACSNHVAAADQPALRIEPRRFATAGSNPKRVTNPSCLTVNDKKSPHYKYNAETNEADYDPAKPATVALPGDTVTCDHIVELQFLKTVLESEGGPCEQYAVALKDGKKEEYLNKFFELTDIINNQPNLVYADKVFETPKGNVANFIAEGRLDKALSLRFPKGVSLALDDYVNRKTASYSRDVASRLDAKIAKEFPGTKLKVQEIMDQMKTTVKELAANAVDADCEEEGESSTGKAKAKRGPKTKACRRPQAQTSSRLAEGSSRASATIAPTARPTSGGRQANPPTRQPNNGGLQSQSVARPQVTAPPRRPNTDTRQPSIIVPAKPPGTEPTRQRQNGLPQPPRLQAPVRQPTISAPRTRPGRNGRSRRDGLAALDGILERRLALAMDDVDAIHQVTDIMKDVVKRGMILEDELYGRGVYETLESLD